MKRKNPIVETWRRDRDLVLGLAHRAGLSQRLLAEVFGMSRANVYLILDSLSARAREISARPEAKKPRMQRRIRSPSSTGEGPSSQG